MKKIDHIVKDLDNIITKNIDRYKFPEVKGNSIRISYILIRSSKKYNYVIVDTKTNRTIDTTYSKSGAIAIALSVLKNKNYSKISKYDSIIEKHDNDRLFYSNIIKNTPEEIKKEIMIIRFDEAKNKIYWAKSVLDNHILNDIG